MSDGEKIPIELTFDNRGPFPVSGIAVGRSFVGVPMPADSELITQFRQALKMTAAAKGQLFAFNLDTTSQLLPALANCVVQSKAGAVVSTKIPAGPPARQPPAVAGARPQPSGDAGVSREMQIEAIELATNFILKSQLQNPRVLSRSETPAEFGSFGAAWKADDVAGAVKIIPPRGDLKGIDVAAAVAASDARACQGNFASGRVSELVDSDVVFRGFATCEDSAGSRIAQHFIVPRKRGGFVLFSVVSIAKVQPGIAREEKLGEFRRAALTAVSQ